MKKKLPRIFYVWIFTLTLMAFVACSGNSIGDNDSSPSSETKSPRWDEVIWDQDSWNHENQNQDNLNLNKWDQDNWG